jgi:hypothetical protein
MNSVVFWMKFLGKDVGTGLVPNLTLGHRKPQGLSLRKLSDSHKGCPYINDTILFISIIIILLNCTSKIIKPNVPEDIPPKEIPKFAFTQLKYQHSFRFHLHFKTDLPTPIEAEFDGKVILPNQEERTGVWDRIGEKTSTQIKGIGDFQYEKMGSKWEIHPRGEESNILVQIERILVHSDFELKSQDSKQMAFSFKPNLIFLDPSQAKPMTGTLIIKVSSLLPEEITVSDSTKTAIWEIRFSDYNRIKNIAMPFVPKLRIQIGAESKTETQKIIDRFQRIGFQARARTFSSTFGPIIEIQLEQDISETQLNLIISQGKVEIYSGEWISGSTVISPDTSLIKIYETRPVLLKEMLIANKDIERADADFTQGPKPILELYLKPQAKAKLNNHIRNGRTILFILFNDEILGLKSFEQNQAIDKITFEGIGDVTKVSTIAAIINSGLIKQPLRLLSRSKL